MDLMTAYRLCWDIIRLKPVMFLVLVLFTAKIAFAATDGITGLKLIEMGVPKDRLAGLAIFLTPVQILLPWLLGRYTAGPRPLDVFLKAYPVRIMMGGVLAVLVWWTPAFRSTVPGAEPYPASFYAVWVLAYCFHQIATYSIFVSTMAFSAQISDPLVGGTYMTLLNTINNLGGNWPVTLVLFLVDKLTVYQCYARADSGGASVIISTTACNGTAAGTSACKALGDGASCLASVDGYYLLVAGCSVVGLFWWRLMARRVRGLQTLDKRQWACAARPR